MLDKKTVREIARRYAEEVKKVLEPTAILIFGSYINGNPHDRSDIDIAVIMHDYQGDWLKTYSMLFKLKRDEFFIDIEPHLLDET
ncbi:MAG: nucleotidyltransferase domain-containing protein, partial [Clostridiales bacterium]|nr:nucleotidyltransferase domain-containing protein [Clostridiales bacterium]